MKILIYSRVFWPSVGGVEAMMEILAEEFTAAGSEVTVVTHAAGGTMVPSHNYEIVRSPSLAQFVRLLRRSDVCLCANISLRGLGPMLIAGRPLVISHHGPYGSPDKISIVSEIKKTITYFTNNICVSKAVQSTIPGPSVVIPNTYRNEIFRSYDDVTRDLDIIFVGRLVSDKGVLDLVDALGHLRQTGLRAQLSIVGDGPEIPAVLTRVGELGLGSQVGLGGVKRGSDLARFVARHRVMVVPSRWAEPFGIVALEGIACGCVVVGTHVGGLPEAIGPCGVTVPKGDTAGIARAIKLVLEDDCLRAQYRSHAGAHLALHSRSVVATSYLEVLRSVV